MDSYDVVVLGTGAAGLTAALAAADSGASVGLFEKGAAVGGTTALSSGVIWLPGNRYTAQAGAPDPRADGLRYLASLSNGLIDPALAEAFVDTVPELLDWLDTTPLRLQLCQGFPDYHPDHPGGRPQGGRSLEPALFPFPLLGEWGDRFVGTPRRMTVAETPTGGGTGFLAPEVAARREAEGLEGLGRALAGALLRGCLDRGVEPHLGRRAVELVTDGSHVGHGDGTRVTGVRLVGPDGPVEVAARRGVVLATGGFEWDRALVRDFLRGPMTHPASVPTNTGDGLRMAMKLGASLGTMREAWWVPVAELPGRTNQGEQAVYLVLRERTMPRSIMVNAAGHRFTNEATNYNALGGAFHAIDVNTLGYDNQPCWVVFDAGHVEAYGGFQAPPGQVPDWVHRADDLDGLAEAIGVPATALARTVTRWNSHAEAGHDPDFHRGECTFDGFFGDRRFWPGPASTIGPLDQAPFYAVQLHSGTLGTKGGPHTDADGAVLDVDGHVVRGLFAAGNAMACVTGMVYGGAGGTLGPALVFGYRAGSAAARA